LSRLAKMHREMQEDGTLPRGSKVDSRSGVVLLRNRGVRKALKWRKRREACERQAICISKGRTREGKIPSALENF
jgi:hypothetical protein